MADPIALQVKPPQVMTLGDMVNIARGVQSYQQAEQINPLIAQKAQMEIEQAQKANPLALTKSMMEIEQARKMNPLAVAKSTEEVSQAEIGTKAKQLELDQSHFNLSGNIISGLESRAQTLKKKGDTATALKELEAAEQWMNASGVPTQENGSIKLAKEQLKKKDFDGYLATIENMRNILGGASSRFQSNLPQVATVGGAPATFTQSSGIAKPLEIGGQQPTVTPPPQSGGQPNVVPPQGGTQAQGVTPIQMSLPYPVRRAGDIRPLAPSEVTDQAGGQKYRESLAKEYKDLATYRRSTDEVIREAEKIGKEEWNQGAGFFGKMGRNFSTFLGTDQGIAYKNLSKALANVNMNSMKALGMSTDADKTLSAAANGDYTYPPEVLTHIASQAHGNMTNIELQAKGVQAFAKKYGDSNYQVFQDLWNSNSKDTRVFEAIAINDSNIPQKEKIKKIDKLLEDMSPTEIDALTKSKNRLLKLSKTGEL
jgi:hypothetical protein